MASLVTAEIPNSEASLDRLRGLLSVVLLLKKEGPRTSHEIEMVCSLSRYTRLKYLRVLENAGIVEHPGRHWQLTSDFAAKINPFVEALRKGAV